MNNLSVLSRVRSERGLSQTELGNRVGVSNKTISSLETGNTSARPNTALRIVEELHFQAPLAVEDANELLAYLGLGTAVFERIKTNSSQSGMSQAEARAILNHVLHRIGLETFAALANGVLADAHAAQMQVVKVVQPPERGTDGKLYQVTKVIAPPGPAHKSTSPRAAKKAN